jgi:glycosyltransferase involved in cell wall biosynthesis
MVQSKINARVSIVIPVYNEAEHLTACLRAIAVQTVLPHEVIVVDNNSSDNSISIAQSFPFVTLLVEKRQGVVHARRRGFDTAQGEIIGRIDADTIVSPNWVETIERIFCDSTVDAVSGSVRYYDVTSPMLSGYFDLFFRQRLAKQLGDEVFLYGANMALRRSLWCAVRGSLCTEAGLHEDFDLAIHAEAYGARVVFNKELEASVSLRRFDAGIVDFWRYALLSPSTYARHGRKSQKHMYIIIVIAISTYWFIWLNHRIYDTELEQVSFRRLVTTTATSRVNPATFVE